MMLCVDMLFASSPADIPSAKPIFFRLGIEQGLPQNSVEAIVQDKQGFMWFGTQDGVCRYDGYSFLTFRPKKNDSTALQNAAVSALLVDKHGTLWVGTEGGGLARYNAPKQTFTSFRHDAKNPRSISDDVIESLYEDTDGTIWIGTEHGGLNRFDSKSGVFTAFKHDPANPRSIGANRVYNMLRDKQGTLWVSTYGGGLNRLNAADGSFTRFRYDSTHQNSLSNDFLYGIAHDDDGNIWAATYGGGLNRFTPANGKWKRFLHDPANPASLNHNGLRALAFDRTGRLWVSTDGGGVCVFDHTTERFERYRHNPNDASTLSGNFARALFCDASGIMWVGTNVAGLSYTAPSANKFALFRNEAGNARTLSDNVVRYIHEALDGTIWLGTGNGGLNAFNSTTGEFQTWRRDSLNRRTLSNDAVWTIADAPNGLLWVGTHNGLNLFNPRTGESEVFVNKPNDSTTLTTNLVRALQPARDGSLWVGLIQSGGLCRFDPATKRFIRYLNDPKNPRSLGSNYVRALAETRDGRIWVGTWSGGLCRFDAERGDFTVFKTDMENPHGLRSNVIRVLYEDRSGTLWAGTPDGLHKLDDSEKGVFTVFTESDGLPNNVIYSIQEDAAGNLWLGTNKGLCRFNPRTKECRAYTTADGLQSNEFNGLASCRTRDGRMYFGGVAGFNGFVPENVRDNASIPAVVLTELSIFNTHIRLDTAIELAHSITVRHDDNFTIGFAALDFTRPVGNSFAYMLEGLDNRWTEAGTKHEATYTSLPPGEYVFRVRGANSDGVWNTKGCRLRIIVLPPWWMTWYVRTACVVALCAAVFGIYHWRVAYLHTRAGELQQKVEEQTHELRDANAEISRQLDILSEQAAQIEISHASLQEANGHLEARNRDLAVLNTEKNEFLGIVSHDLKNPIGAIRGLAELIESDYAESDQVPQIAAQIVKTSNRMLDLVRNLLDINRLETGGMEMNFCDIDIAPMVEGCVMQYQDAATPKNITIEYSNEATNSTVFADEQAVMQVLDNIVSNAVKYSPHGKNIFVRVKTSDEAVRVEVQDEGEGISPEDMMKLFGKFARLSARPTGGEHSTGLGLSIVKKMVEAMNGKVWCESEWGKGATFIVELPIYQSSTPTV